MSAGMDAVKLKVSKKLLVYVYSIDLARKLFRKDPGKILRPTAPSGEEKSWIEEILKIIADWRFPFSKSGI